MSERRRVKLEGEVKWTELSVRAEVVSDGQ